MEIVLATRNLKKLQELKSLLKNLEVRILTLNDFPNIPQTVEDGTTFEENALKKATEVCKFTNHFTIADDSGLEVEGLNGAPGIYSARFAGEGADDRMNNEKLLFSLKAMEGEKRKARYVCAIAIAFPDGHYKVVKGECKGIIARRLSGRCGFGYDPLFFLPRYNKTMAQISPSLKNKISHRAIALRKAYRLISKK